MKKSGIDTVGPKSFLQLKSKYSSENENELESEMDSSTHSENTIETEIEKELNMDRKSEEEAQNKGKTTEEVDEKDQLGDDDDEVAEPSKKPKEMNKPKKKKIPYVFTEVSSQTLSENTNTSEAKNKSTTTGVDKSIVYNAPQDKFNTQQMDKIKILRENSMRQLQKTHVWTPAKAERQHERFSKIKYQQGNKNADLFVSFLGYIRDTSYKQSPPLFDKIKRRFTK